MIWCDLLFALISLGVFWWKVAVLALFSSFFTYQSWFNKAVFLLDSSCISSGPQGSIQHCMAAWLCAIQVISLSTDPLLWQQMSPHWLILLFPSTANQSLPLHADQWTGNCNSSHVLLWWSLELNSLLRCYSFLSYLAFILLFIKGWSVQTLSVMIFWLPFPL